VQAINTAILDKRPDWRKYESYVILAICIVCWLLAIPMVYSGGIYLFKLMDWHTASWAILLIGFAEVIVASWFYGCKRFLSNLVEMKMHFGSILYEYWWLCWVVLAPITCLVSLNYAECFHSESVLSKPHKIESFRIPRCECRCERIHGSCPCYCRTKLCIECFAISGIAIALLQSPVSILVFTSLANELANWRFKV